MALIHEADVDLKRATEMFQTMFVYVVGHVIIHFADPDVELVLVRYNSLDPQAFPLLVELGAAPGTYAPDQVFTVGLDALLDGLETRLMQPRLGSRTSSGEQEV